jgi:L-ascorbate metabolism protein UlaG (beta-lactamase superfamily)
VRLTKFGHACVRLEKDGRSVVIDPGGMTPEADAVDGVEAILVTHEHFDHFAPERVRQAAEANPGLRVYTCAGVARHLADLGERVTVLEEGQRVPVAGFEVTAVGHTHQAGHPDVPPVDNVGFLLDGAVFHPGDALTPVEVPTLLVAGQAPWMSFADLVMYLRAVAPQRAFAIHDGLLNAWGLQVLDGQLAGEASRLGVEVRRLTAGESVDLPPA